MTARRIRILALCTAIAGEISLVCLWLGAGQFPAGAQKREHPLVSARRAAPSEPLRPSKARLKVYDAAGKLAPKSELTLANNEGFVTGVYLLDVNFNPIPWSVATVEEGYVTLAEPVPSPLIAHFYPRVQGFGQVKIFVDNGGKGYTPPAGARWELDLPLEAARSRIAYTRTLTDNNPAAVFRKETRDRLSTAVTALNAATKTETVDAAKVYESLRDALWASEMATVDVARETIRKNARRSDFHFGIFTEGWETWKEKEKEAVRAVFDFGTVLSFFISSYEDETGKPQPEAAEKAVFFAEDLGLQIKGHTLIYLIPPNLPSRLKGKVYEDFKKLMRYRVLRDTRQFKGRIRIWDVLNEGHASHATYTNEQMVDLARVGIESAREGDSRALSAINVTYPIGDYVVIPEVRESAARSPAKAPITPFQHLQKMVETGVPFDIVGIEMYYWGLDMVELSRLLDRYAKLGKTIHVTEVGIPSASGVDRASQFFQDEQFIDVMGEWHRPWDEATQADWAEQFYTIAYSKSAVRSVTWTSYTDHFWPHGGLAKRDLTLKQAYWRLRYLIRSWGFTGAAPTAPSPSTK